MIHQMSAPLHPEDIKARIRKRGGSLSAIARDLGISHQAVSKVLWGRGSSERVERAIAIASGLSRGEVYAAACSVRGDHGPNTGPNTESRSARRSRRSCLTSDRTKE